MDLTAGGVPVVAWLEQEASTGWFVNVASFVFSLQYNQYNNIIHTLALVQQMYLHYWSHSRADMYNQLLGQFTQRRRHLL